MFMGGGALSLYPDVLQPHAGKTPFCRAVEQRFPLEWLCNLVILGSTYQVIPEAHANVSAPCGGTLEIFL